MKIDKWTIAGLTATIGSFALNLIANKKAKHDMQETVATEVAKQIDKIRTNNDQ